MSTATLDALEPPITDESGYRVRHVDVHFLHLSLADIEHWRSRKAPLGMTVSQFHYFIQTLGEALARDGINTVDVRLKGSSAQFFAGPHKPMPRTRAEIVQVFRALRDRTPEPDELDEISTRFHDLWDERSCPRQRPFDSLHRLRVDRYPSDYDLQISSDEIVARARAQCDDLNIPLAAFRVESETYDFVEKDLLEKTCPFLVKWAFLRSDILGRQVTLAVFPSEGPPNRVASHGSLSSHFRASDWILISEEARTS